MLTMKIAQLAWLAPLWLVGACSDKAERVEDAAQAQARDTFWNALLSHCNKAYDGRLVSRAEADPDFAGRTMRMHVKTCAKDRIAIPFHVETAPGEWDRSRTWVITRNANGFTLKHDHRHKDGSSDTVTMYGGDTVEKGSARAQHFLIDAESIALFGKNGLEESLTNIWTIEIDAARGDASGEGAEAGPPAGGSKPGDGASEATKAAGEAEVTEVAEASEVAEAPEVAEAQMSSPLFAYQLKRTKARGAPRDRLFRVEFDLAREVEAPPAAWGHE